MTTNSWILLSTHIFYLFIYFIFLHQCLHIHRTCLNKNAPILASCSFDKHRLILIIFDKQHQHSFEDYVPTKLSLALHFYLFYLLLNSSDGNDAKRIGRLLAPDGSEKSRFTNQIKKDPQIDVLSPSRMHVTAFSSIVDDVFATRLPTSMKRCFKSLSTLPSFLNFCNDLLMLSFKSNLCWEIPS